MAWIKIDRSVRELMKRQKLVGTLNVTGIRWFKLRLLFVAPLIRVASWLLGADILFEFKCNNQSTLRD